MLLLFSVDAKERGDVQYGVDCWQINGRDSMGKMADGVWIEMGQPMGVQMRQEIEDEIKDPS